MSSLLNLPIDDIQVVSNVRREFNQEKLEELAQSVREFGILEPLVVRWDVERSAWVLVAGERRLRAAKIAGLEEVPVVTRSLSEADAAKIQLLENLQRVDLSAVETAEALQQLIEAHGMKQEDLAGELGVSQPWISNRLRLLKLPEEVQDYIRRGMLTAGHGEHLLKLSAYPGDLVDVAQKAAERGESTRGLAALVSGRHNEIRWREQMAEEAKERQVSQPDPDEEARRAREREDREREWEIQRKKREYDEGVAGAVRSAAIDYLAPADDLTLWAVAVAQKLTAVYSWSEKKAVYEAVGVKPADPATLEEGNWDRVPDEDRVKICEAVKQWPIAELRKFIFKDCITYIGEPFISLLREALPEKARALVDEREEKIRRRIYGDDDQAEEPEPTGIPVNAELCPGCNRWAPISEVEENGGLCRECTVEAEVDDLTRVCQWDDEKVDISEFHEDCGMCTDHCVCRQTDEEGMADAS